MGAESRCTVRFGRQRSEGKALLETDHLIFRGEFRLAIPRKAITEADAKDGTLRITFPDGIAQFDLSLGLLNNLSKIVRLGERIHLRERSGRKKNSCTRDSKKHMSTRNG